MQRRITAERTSFLEDVVLAAGLKLCTDMSRPPEGRSMYIEPHQHSFNGCNFMLTPCFAVPTYMSVNKQSPTFKERSAQEKERAIDAFMLKLAEEGVRGFEFEGRYTDDAKIYIQL
jgi:hypothetical protein